MTEATGSGRRNRRTVVGGAAGILVLVAVAIVVVVHATGGSGAPLPAVSPYPKDYVAPFERVLQAPVDAFPDDMARFGHFVDGSHGFLAADRCVPTGPRRLPDSCRRVTMATSDGGATLTELTAAPLAEFLFVFGPRDLVVARVASHPANSPPPTTLPLPPMRHWVSHDAGATWQEVIGAGAPINRIPAGAQLLQVSLGSYGVGGILGYPVETVSADGSMHQLLGLPGDGFPLSSRQEQNPNAGPVHGAYFVAGFGGAADTLVTRDDGATWQPTTLPGWLEILGYDGHQFLAGGPNTTLYASPDGVKWHKVTMPTFIPVRWAPPAVPVDRPLADPSVPPGTRPSDNLHPQTQVDMALSPAGLLVTDETNMFRLVPGTSRFVLLAGVPSTADFTGLGGRVVALQVDGDHLREVSTVDGRTWTPMGYR